MMSTNTFTEFRADGWPLCPNCGEDELWCDYTRFWHEYGHQPTVIQCIAIGLQCHLCHSVYPGDMEILYPVKKSPTPPVPPMGHDSAMMVDDDYLPVEPLYKLREVEGEVYHQSPLNYEEW